MAKIKIISPTKKQLVEKRKQLSPIRFEYRGKIYEVYEPYFLVSLIAKKKKMSIKNLLFLELLTGQKLSSLKNNAEQEIYCGQKI
jgi:hypothetical protein